MRLTIGMPVYNGAETIAAALDSLLAQSARDFILVISDNGSTDATEEICRRYADADPRIRYVRQEVNLGAAMNFRFVLFEARTPFFMWAAADDLWAPRFVEENLAELEAHPEAVASQSRVLFTKAGRPSHLSTGTRALTGTVKENLARYLRNPADNSRYYGVFRTEVLQRVFPVRSFHALDWGVAAATLQYGTHREIERVLMIRDSSDARVYEESVCRDHRFLLWRIFPVLFVTKWLIFERRIPLSLAILRSLLFLNLYIHFRYGLYRIGWLADRYMAVRSRGGFRTSFTSMLRPQLGARVRAAAAAGARRLRGILRPIWRALPLGLRAREAVKFHLVEALGPVATEDAGIADYSVVPTNAFVPLPPDPLLRGGEDLWRLPTGPEVGTEVALSVVIMARGDLPATLRAIDALVAYPITSDDATEVIVVDIGADDVTALALGRLDGLRFQRSDAPAPLGKALIAGLEQVRGAAIAVLAPGVVPAAGFVRAVLRGLDRAAVIEPQLRHPQGHVLDRTGTATPGGEQVPPGHPFAAAAQPIDRAGSAFAVDRAVLSDLGEIGPLETIDLVSAALIGQARHKGRSAQTWPPAAVYVTEPAAETGMAQQGGEVADKPSEPIPTVLYVDADTPAPDQNAGSILAVSQMRMFDSLGYRVLFVPESNFAHRGRYTEELQARRIIALYANHFTSMRQVLERFGGEVSIVVLCRAYIAERYVTMVRQLAPKAKVLFNTVDLHFLREMRAAELFRDGEAIARAEAQRQSELASIAAVDATIVVSTHEYTLLRELVPNARIHVMPLVRDVPERLDVPGFAARRDIAFIGTYQHPPNEDAVVHFVQHIWPLVRARLPDARFLICGSSLTEKVAALGGDGVEVVGFVPDLDALLAKCRLTVAPLRFGAGLKGKVVTSLAAGVPTVASSIAIEGSGLRDGIEVVVADTPEDTAAAVARLYENEGVWNEFSRNGFEFVRRAYTLEVHTPRLAALLTEIKASTIHTQIHALQEELRRAGPAFVPSEFWQRLADTNIRQIDRHGLKTFKRTINNNYFQFLPSDFGDPQVHNLVAFWSARPSHIPIEAACNADRLVDGFTIKTAFGYDPFANPAYARFYGFFVGLLWYWAGFHDPIGISATLEEPELGAPIPVRIGGRLISQDLANSLHEWSRISTLMQTLRTAVRPRVLELGAGYGRLAHVALHARRCRYAIVDIAPALAIAEWYLTKVHPDLRVFSFRHFDRYEDVADEIEAADLCFFSANQMALLPPGFADAGVAISCLHEMRRDQIALYLDLLATRCRQVIYLKNWESWTNEADGLTLGRDDYRIGPPWQCVLDEAHPINPAMWETGYVRKR